VFEDAAGAVGFAVEEDGDGLAQGLEAEVGGAWVGGGGAIDAIEERGEVEELGAMLEEIEVGDLSLTQRTSGFGGIHDT
jgi:hypothetical protein